MHNDVSLEVPFAGNLVDSMIDALHAEDPGAKVLPYTLSGGTDNKSLSRLGITGYGFAPLQLPDELDFTGHVPRRGRARPRRVPEIRRPGTGHPADQLLTPEDPAHEP